MNRRVWRYKYLVFAAAICLLSVLCILQGAGAAEWMLLGKTRLGTFYFDQKSISDVSDNVKSVHTKIVFSKEGRKKEIEWKKKQKAPVKKIDQLRRLSHRIESHEFDCRKKQHRFVMSAEYSLKGVLLERTNFQGSTFLPIAPCTMEEDMWNIVCEKGKCGKNEKGCQ